MASKYLDTSLVEKWGLRHHLLNLGGLVTALTSKEYDGNNIMISMAGSIDDVACSLGHSSLEA